MPRQTTPKPLPRGSKPYPDPGTFSKAQVERIVRAVVLALTTTEEPYQQTTHSEDEEDAEDEDHNGTTPETLSSSSCTDSLRASLAPLEDEVQKSSKMLRKLLALLPKFVSSNNQPGTVKCTELIVRHEKIIIDTEARIVSVKEAWDAQECAKKLAEKELLAAAKEKEASKSKGKTPAARTEG